jgi:hypothetical protein
VAPEREEEQIGTEAAGEKGGAVTSGGLGRPFLIAATFAAGAGVALGTKAFLDSRRKRGSEDGNSNDGNSSPDLPTILRDAALDVAIAATNQAAKRLGRGESASQSEEPAQQRS